MTKTQKQSMDRSTGSSNISVIILKTLPYKQTNKSGTWHNLEVFFQNVDQDQTPEMYSLILLHLQTCANAFENLKFITRCACETPMPPPTHFFLTL